MGAMLRRWGWRLVELLVPTDPVPPPEQRTEKDWLLEAMLISTPPAI